MLQIAYLVSPKDERKGLHSGCGAYSRAVVVSLNPFVLISEGGDMVWYTKNRDDFEKGDRPSATAAKNVLERIDRDAEVRKVVQEDTRRILRQLAKG